MKRKYHNMLCSLLTMLQIKKYIQVFQCVRWYICDIAKSCRREHILSSLSHNEVACGSAAILSVHTHVIHPFSIITCYLDPENGVDRMLKDKSENEHLYMKYIT